MNADEQIKDNTRRIEELEDAVWNLWFTVSAARVVVTVALSIMIAINLGFL